MAKPTQQELEEALAEAARMREQGEDPRHVAKCLLNHHYRLGYLEEVLQAVERYLLSGLAEAEHRRLLQAVDKARQAEARTGHSSRDELGLG
jgi:hemoglobin-like flavoprotein